MTAVMQGRAGILQLLRRYVRWRLGISWYLVVLLGVPAPLPDAGPHEEVWNLLTRSEFKHACCRDIPQMAKALGLAKPFFRHR